MDRRDGTVFTGKLFTPRGAQLGEMSGNWGNDKVVKNIESVAEKYLLKKGKNAHEFENNFHSSTVLQARRKQK